jgi:hypothetical protein
VIFVREAGTLNKLGKFNLTPYLSTATLTLHEGQIKVKRISENEKIK